LSGRIVLFEDARWRDLRPLTDLVPVPGLAFGASTLGRRWSERPGWSLLAVAARPLGTPLAAGRAAAGDLVLAVNAAALPGPWADEIVARGAPVLALSGERVAAALVPFGRLAPLLGDGPGFAAALAGLGLPAVSVEARVAAYPWNLVEWNADAIATDLAGMAAGIAGEVHPSAVILGPDRVHVARGARVEPLAVLDARPGPIRVGENVVIAPRTVVTGPCAIGAGTQLLGGSIGRSTIGPECRIAGEVEECIWQGHANKRHHGFVGHSLIGPWVNLGALTTTSDLKNNYGTVRVWVDGREMESGVRKIGALIGAHVKTGIGSLLPTGASIGTGANLFGGGRFAPKRVPSFGWWDGERMIEHRLEPFLTTARTAMGRRGNALSAADESALKELFAATAGERAVA